MASYGRKGMNEVAWREIEDCIDPSLSGAILDAIIQYIRSTSFQRFPSRLFFDIRIPLKSSNGL